ncbi:hypothetical protein PR048_031103 [Dryococelus australis]|uniref:Uncharacterized protein n=1 Tax=Dryococelus australis TaxID=614101 RepID=A0ABQ9G5G6_9NEOP|nr:hypothetical protein PR048_031103 [Dryococelus australis]
MKHFKQLRIENYLGLEKVKLLVPSDEGDIVGWIMCPCCDFGRRKCDVTSGVHFRYRLFTMNGEKGEVWTALNCEALRADEGEASAGMQGRGNGRSPRKPVDQRHRPARFPHVKIRERTRRESNPVRAWWEANIQTCRRVDVAEVSILIGWKIILLASRLSRYCDSSITRLLSKFPLYLELSSTFETKERGVDKVDTSTHIKCASAIKREALNWRVSFSSCRVFLRDFLQRLALLFCREHVFKFATIVGGNPENPTIKSGDTVWHCSSESIVYVQNSVTALDCRRIKEYVALKHLEIHPVIPIKPPYDRVKQCRERKINIKASGRVNRSVNLRVQGQEARERYGRHQHARPAPHRSYAQGVQCFRRGPLIWECVARVARELCVARTFRPRLFVVCSQPRVESWFPAGPPPGMIAAGSASEADKELAVLHCGLLMKRHTSSLSTRTTLLVVALGRASLQFPRFEHCVVEMEQRWNAMTCGNREIPEKPRRPAASSRTIPTCENPGKRFPFSSPLLQNKRIYVLQSPQDSPKLVPLVRRDARLFSHGVQLPLWKHEGRIRGRGDRAVSLLASHQGEPVSVPGRVTPGFSRVGIVPDDATVRWVFSGISRFPRPFIPAPLHTHLISPSFYTAGEGEPTPLTVPQSFLFETLLSQSAPLPFTEELRRTSGRGEPTPLTVPQSFLFETLLSQSVPLPAMEELRRTRGRGEPTPLAVPQSFLFETLLSQSAPLPAMEELRRTRGRWEPTPLAVPQSFLFETLLTQSAPLPAMEELRRTRGRGEPTPLAVPQSFLFETLLSQSAPLPAMEELRRTRGRGEPTPLAVPQSCLFETLLSQSAPLPAMEELRRTRGRGEPTPLAVPQSFLFETLLSQSAPLPFTEELRRTRGRGEPTPLAVPQSFLFETLLSQSAPLPAMEELRRTRGRGEPSPLAVPQSFLFETLLSQSAPLPAMEELRRTRGRGEPTPLAVPQSFLFETLLSQSAPLPAMEELRRTRGRGEPTPLAVPQSCLFETLLSQSAPLPAMEELRRTRGRGEPTPLAVPQSFLFETLLSQSAPLPAMEELRRTRGRGEPTPLAVPQSFLFETLLSQSAPLPFTEELRWSRGRGSRLPSLFPNPSSLKPSSPKCSPSRHGGVKKDKGEGEPTPLTVPQSFLFETLLSQSAPLPATEELRRTRGRGSRLPSLFPNPSSLKPSSPKVLPFPSRRREGEPTPLTVPQSFLFETLLSQSAPLPATEELRWTRGRGEPTPLTVPQSFLFETLLFQSAPLPATEEGEGLGKESAMASVRDPSQHSPGVITERHGKPKSGSPDRESNPGLPECESKRRFLHKNAVFGGPLRANGKRGAGGRADPPFTDPPSFLFETHPGRSYRDKGCTFSILWDCGAGKMMKDVVVGRFEKGGGGGVERVSVADSRIDSACLAEQ